MSGIYRIICLVLTLSIYVVVVECTVCPEGKTVQIININMQHSIWKSKECIYVTTVEKY